MEYSEAIAGAIIILVAIVGITIALLPKRKKMINKEHRFLQYNELAKKAEFKGQYKEAIDYYMDSLYSLENDFVKEKLDNKSEKGRQKKILNIRAKIEGLKKKLSEEYMASTSKPDQQL